ncbi:MAG TPA: acyl-phosphate glycerol 3-phosphate acyltransferase [Ruminococcus sp.]|nr:acyl-phosphate glycerol 3-phosphate acyltransferase [Ruminococcus sp.]
MNNVLWYILFAAGGYLIGCINTAAIIARCKGFDIRTKGSGNAGASNALVTMGKGAAVCSALVDILKAFLPVFLLLHVFSLDGFPPHLPILTGAAVILGHMFPFWMQFRGGKGFASLLGLTLALDWRFFFVCIAILAVLLFSTRYIALATIACAAITPVWWGLHTRSIPEAILLGAVGICMIVRHFPNLKRIKNGTEIKFREKKKDPADDKQDQT